MTRQIDAGKSYVLSNDTAGKLMKLIGKTKGVRGGTPNTDTNLITVLNSGATADPYTALEVSASVFTEDQSDFFDADCVECDNPSEGSTNLCIITEPLANGETGIAAIGGMVTALVNVSEVSHGFVVYSGGGLVSSQSSGPLKIVTPPTETGEQHLKVRFVDLVVGQGMVHGLLQSDITDTTTQVDVSVTFSLLEDVSVGDIVTALNIIGYSGSLGGDAIVFYHGDGTGNEDGTYTLMGARCPE
jgi:hypothetical protein